MPSRMDRGFRLPNQKYHDPKAEHVNWKYLQEYLNYIRKKDIYGATVVVAAVDSANPHQAHVRCDGTADNEAIESAVAESDANDILLVLLDGNYDFDAVCDFGAKNVIVQGTYPLITVADDGFVGTGHMSFNGLRFTGGASGGVVVHGNSPDGVFIVTNCHFDALTAKACVGIQSDGAGDGEAFNLVTGNIFSDITVAGGGGASPRGVIWMDESGGTFEAVVVGNKFEDCTGGDLVNTNGGRETMVCFNVINSCTIDLNEGNYVHNLIDGVMTAGEHAGTTAIALGDLSDVGDGTPTSGNIIRGDGDSWESTPAAEVVQDIVGAMVTGNTETLISVTYDDSDGTLDFVVNNAAIDHGTLTGLADDDHTQYLNTARHDALDHTTAMSTVVLGDISDVGVGTPTAGNLLEADGDSWESVAPSTMDAADFGSGAATDGWVLTADGAAGAAWEAVPAGGTFVIEDATDVDIDGTPADNELLAYDTGSSQWINQTPAEAGVLALSGGNITGDVEFADSVDLLFGTDSDVDFRFDNTAGSLLIDDVADGNAGIAIGFNGGIDNFNLQTTGATAMQLISASGFTISGGDVEIVDERIRGTVAVACISYEAGGGQTIADSTNTPIDFDTDEYDPHGFHSTSSNTDDFVVPTNLAGVYLMWGQLFWDADIANAERTDAVITVDGAVRGRSNTESLANRRQQVTAIVNLDEGDIVNLVAFHVGGANVSITGGQAETRFAMIRIA